MTVDVEMTDDVEETTVEIEAADVVDEEVAEPVADPFKAKWEGQRKVNRDLERKLKEATEALSAKDKAPEEQALDAARREAREEVLSAANARLVRAELKAELIGKVSNPAAALRLIDASEIEVSGDGDVDSSSVASAVAALLAEVPELAVKSARFQGGADQGAKNKPAEPGQLTQADLQKLSPEQINEARRTGRLNTLLGIK